MNDYITKQDDVLDLLCFERNNKIEDVLNNNPHLALQDVYLTAGIVIKFKDTQEKETETIPTINLWD